MSNKVSLYILNHSGSGSKRISLSRKLIPFLLCAFFTVVVLTLWLGIDYFSLKKRAFAAKNLTANILENINTLKDQKDKIVSQIEVINLLREHIVNLNSFEKSLRVISNIEESVADANLAGRNGTVPVSINTNSYANIGFNHMVRDAHDLSGFLLTACSKQENGFKTLMTHLNDQRDELARTPAIRPTTGWRSSGFGYRISPFTGRRSLHKGLDIANKPGTPIFAPAKGVVVHSGPTGALGISISINHGNGIITRYGHMKKTSKVVGETVNRGDLIGTMGNTGRSTGPHLHYEVLINGVPVNPLTYILG